MQPLLAMGSAAYATCYTLSTGLAANLIIPLNKINLFASFPNLGVTTTSTKPPPSRGERSTTTHRSLKPTSTTTTTAPTTATTTTADNDDEDNLQSFPIYCNDTINDSPLHTTPTSLIQGGYLDEKQGIIYEYNSDLSLWYPRHYIGMKYDINKGYAFNNKLQIHNTQRDPTIKINLKPQTSQHYSIKLVREILVHVHLQNK